MNPYDFQDRRHRADGADSGTSLIDGLLVSIREYQFQANSQLPLGQGRFVCMSQFMKVRPISTADIRCNLRHLIIPTLFPSHTVDAIGAILGPY